MKFFYSFVLFSIFFAYIYFESTDKEMIADKKFLAYPKIFFKITILGIYNG